MRLCRFDHKNEIQFGFFEDDRVCSLDVVATKTGVSLPVIKSLTELLPGGALRDQIVALEEHLNPQLFDNLSVSVRDVRLLVPLPNPGKLLLLAGNYAKHVEEGGDRAEEREKTFPYVFMKPPSTTLTNPGDPICIPQVSPDQIDWELELGVIIGRTCARVSEEEALDYVSGYTVVNDISDRAFRPNPHRVERSRDRFFDWLHGKWHDTFCPLGPCILPSTEVSDPQGFKMTLTVNDNVEQDASTAEMVFPVAAVISFISSFVTLEPGDIISTGTPDGVGKAKGKFLRSGDVVAAEIKGIGRLVNPVI